MSAAFCGKVAPGKNALFVAINCRSQASVAFLSWKTPALKELAAHIVAQTLWRRSASGRIYASSTSPHPLFYLRIFPMHACISFIDFLKRTRGCCFRKFELTTFNGGRGGIRTHGAFNSTLDFESSAFNRTQPPFLLITNDLQLIGLAETARDPSYKATNI